MAEDLATNVGGEPAEGEFIFVETCAEVTHHLTQNITDYKVSMGRRNI